MLFVKITQYYPITNFNSIILWISKAFRDSRNHYMPDKGEPISGEDELLPQEQTQEGKVEITQGADWFIFSMWPFADVEVVRRRVDKFHVVR